MEMRSATKGAGMRKALGAILVGSLGLAGCPIQQPNGDVNRVHKPYLPKSWFQDSGSWYLRRTITAAPPQAWDSIGSGDWPNAERIRFEVREDALLLHRDYELVPGSESAEQPGADYRGTLVASFPIREHFDIRRQFNSLTGEQTNVLERNYDRPWHQREYFDVDWGGTLPNFWGGPPMPSFYIQEQESSNPDRARFNHDYFEFTRRESVEPYLISCWGGLDWGTVPDCGAGVVDWRWSLNRVNADEDFEPTPFPDSVSLVDDNGEFIKENGKHVKVPIFERFGYFRLERLAYDRDRGITDSGRIMRAYKFNIWKRSYDQNGVAIPFDQRQPKPIIYYMNAEVPDDEWSANSEVLAKYTIRQANREIGQEYNKVFRNIVETLQGRTLPEDFKMFEVRQNDCNFEHVVQFAEGNGLQGSLGAVGGLDGFRASHDEVGAACRAEATGRTCSDRRQKWSYKLKQACTALESATENNGDEGSRFTWQRLGDVRYSFVYLTNQLQSVGWLGLGMLAGDPITAEIKNAFAYVDGPGTDLSATTALDMVDAMNDQTLLSDLIYGTDIARYTEMQNQNVGAKLKGYPSQQMVNAINSKFNGLGRTPDELLREAEPASAALARLQAVAGTPLEEILVNQDDIMLAAHRPLPSDTVVTEDLLAKASPARGGMLKLKQALNDRQKKAMGGTEAPCHYLKEFLDDGILGLALAIRDYEKTERWAYLRYIIYKTVMLHEVGHTLGLRHNFQGTYDALNYHDAFWDRLTRYTSTPLGGTERESISVDDALLVVDNGLAAATTPEETASWQAEKDMLNHCKLKVEEDESRWIYECVANDTSNTSEITKFRDCTNQLPAARSAGDTLRVDAMQCVRADEGKSSSVMDYHGKFNGRFMGLGHYDAAALKFAYGQIVEEFAPGALQSITDQSNAGSVQNWLDSNDYKRIPDVLANGAQGVRSRVDHYRPWGANTTKWAPKALEVPYGFCSDEYAYAGGGTDVCRLRDFGGNHREQMEHDILRYKQYYFFTNFARNRLTWDIGGAISSNAQVFDNILRVFQYMYFYRAIRGPAFFETDAGKDFLQASLAGLDLYSEVLAQPEMGTFVSPVASWGFTRSSQTRGRWVRWTAEDLLDLPPGQIDASNGGSGVAVPTYYVNTCEWGDSDTYACGMPAGAGTYPGFLCNSDVCGIDVPLGDGRPSYLNYTDDYEDWFFTYVGNYFDKQNILVNMVYSQAYFPRFSEETVGGDNPNVRLLNIGLSSLFGDSIRTMLHGLITDNIREYGSVYRPGVGYVPRSFNSLDSTSVVQPTDVVLIPRRITNLPYLALLYGAAFQSSLNDGVLDFVNIMQIGVRGEEDDIAAWDLLPAADKAEFTHPLTGVTYRAAKVGDQPIGYELVADAKRLAGKYLERQQCVDMPTKSDGVCACTYVGAFYTDDKNGDGDIHGTGSGGRDDECILYRPELGLNPCQSRVESCETEDRTYFRDIAFERMEAAVERLENVRSFYQSFQGSWRL